MKPAMTKIIKLIEFQVFWLFFFFTLPSFLKYGICTTPQFQHVLNEQFRSCVKQAINTMQHVDKDEHFSERFKRKKASM